MKKICSLLLSLTMMFSLAATFGITANAADTPDTFWRGFETNEKDYRDDRGAVSEWVEEGVGGSHGALKIQNGVSEVSEPQYGGVTWEKIVNVPTDRKYNVSMCIKPLEMENTNFSGTRAMFVFYHYYKQDDGSERNFHDIVYFSNVEELSDGWLKLSYNNYTMSSGTAGNAQTPTGTYSGYSRIEFRAGRPTGTYLIDDLRVEPVPGEELETGNESEGPVYLVNSSYETENTDIGGADGTAGCKLVKPTSNTGDGLSFGDQNLKPGQAYKFSWWAKGTTNAEDASLSTNGLYLYGYLNSYFTLENGAPKVTYNIIMKNDQPLSDEWQYYECIFKTPNQTVPEECYDRLVSFYPRLHSTAWNEITGGLGDFAGKAGMEYYIDEIKVQELEPVYNGGFEVSLDELVYGHERQPGYKPWITETGTTAVNVSEDNKNFARVTQTGAETDGFSAYVAMDPSVSYKITFDAKSDVEGAKLGAVIHKAEDDTAASTLADLTSEWASYEVTVTNTDSLIQSPKLTFTMTDGSDPLAGSYDIDNVSFEVLKEEYESAISATSKEIGGIITGSADFDGSEDFGFARVFISNDGITWGQLSEGETGAGASSSYTITEKDAGKYIRFMYTPGLTEGADYIYTPSIRTAAREIYFTGTWGTNLAAEANIITDTFAGEEFIAVIAQYNSEDEMLSVKTYDLNELMGNASGTYSIPCEAVAGASYAKAYLWNNLEVIAPHCVSDTAYATE